MRWGTRTPWHDHTHDGAMGHKLSIVIFLLSILLLTGCTSYQPLPKSAYSDEDRQLFSSIPDELKSPTVEILYATDRARIVDKKKTIYGRDRSPSLAFGSARVNLGRDLSWDDVMTWTVSEGGARRAIEPRISSIVEISKLPPSPYPFTEGKDGRVILESTIAAQRDRAQRLFQEAIRQRLSRTERKSVEVLIHGVGDKFNETLIRTGVLHHLFGRQGVAVLYSWPAGQVGGLRGYSRDRESGEFTVFHLKEFFRTLTEVDEIGQINISAHSRGADVILTALRELIIEARASGSDPRKQLRIANLILIAPDLDSEVVSQRVNAEALNLALDRVTIYVNDRDAAISASSALFASDRRIGSYNPSQLTAMQRQRLEALGNVDIIAYSGQQGGFLGHSYYRAPVVLADVFLLLRGALPGGEHGRPLKPLGPSVWSIDDRYLQ